FRLIVLLLADFVFGDQLLVAGQIGLSSDAVRLGLSDVGNGGLIIPLSPRERRPSLGNVGGGSRKDSLGGDGGDGYVRPGHCNQGARLIQRSLRLFQRHFVIPRIEFDQQL